MKQGAKPPRVLVIRGGAIGDFILTLPAIRLLRDNIPGAHIEILGYKPIIELALAAGIADSTRSLEHAAMARLFVPRAELGDELRDYLLSFNLIVSYLFDPDSILRGNMEAMGVKTYIEASHQVTPGAGHAAVQLAGRWSAWRCSSMTLPRASVSPGSRRRPESRSSPSTRAAAP